MANYKATWRAVKDGSIEIGNNLYPAAIEFEAQGDLGAPNVSARFEMRDGVPEVVDFRISAKKDGRAVRTADLNSWQPLEGLALNAFRKWARRKDPEPGAKVYGPKDERDFWRIGSELESAQGSRRGPSRAELEEVAQIYALAIEGRPTEAVQKQKGLSRRTAARRVQQAREAGLLPPTSAGRKKA